jgi:hypothetical protein
MSVGLSTQHYRPWQTEVVVGIELSNNFLGFFVPSLDNQPARALWEI